MWEKRGRKRGPEAGLGTVLRGLTGHGGERAGATCLCTDQATPGQGSQVRLSVRETLGPGGHTQ